MDKLQIDLSINYGFTGETIASIIPEKRIPKKKRNKKSLALSPPRKYTIPNQDKNNLGLQKYQCPPPHVSSFYSWFKSLRNEENDDNSETIDTSRTDKYDTSRTYQDDYMENLKSMKDINDDDE